MWYTVYYYHAERDGDRGRVTDGVIGGGGVTLQRRVSAAAAQACVPHGRGGKEVVGGGGYRERGYVTIGRYYECNIVYIYTSYRYRPVTRAVRVPYSACIP